MSESREIQAGNTERREEDQEREKIPPFPPVGGGASDSSPDSFTLEAQPPGKPAKRRKRKPAGPTPEDERDFAALYDAYPRHEARKPAFSAFVKLRRAGKLPDLDLLTSKAREYGRERKHSGAPPDKIALLATWLNGERWHDEYQIAPPQKTNSTRQRLAGPQSGPGVFDQITYGDF